MNMKKYLLNYLHKLQNEHPITNIEDKYNFGFNDAIDYILSELESFSGIQIENKTPIEELNLSVRLYNRLKQLSINFVEEIEAMSDTQLLNLRNMSNKSLVEIREEIERFRNCE